MKKSEAAIERSLQAAKKELQDIEAKLRAVEHLRQRKIILQTFISAGEALAAPTVKQRPAHPSPAPQAAPPLPIGTGQPRVSDGAYSVLQDRKVPMSVTAIAEEMQRRGWKLSQKWAREVVRAAVATDSRFEKAAPGVFAIREWPESMKKVS
ncbi:MAG: winged helix-turn-helix domain-containing protein [Candidatus Polarisedimenticolia bacterium]